MRNVLSMRLFRLEKQTYSGAPYSHLTEQELQTRIEEITRRIESQVGMSILDYAAVIDQALQAGEVLPDNWTEAEARALVASIPKDTEAGGSHAR